MADHTLQLIACPSRKSAADVETTTLPPLPMAHRWVTLLLVEDNDVDALLVKRLLRRIDLGVNVIRAHDGEEALRLVMDDTTGTAPLPRPLVVLR